MKSLNRARLAALIRRGQKKFIGQRPKSKALFAPAGVFHDFVRELLA